MSKKDYGYQTSSVCVTGYMKFNTIKILKDTSEFSPLFEFICMIDF